jgi:hypothetical protein
MRPSPSTADELSSARNKHLTAPPAENLAYDTLCYSLSRQDRDTFLIQRALPVFDDIRCRPVWMHRRRLDAAAIDVDVTQLGCKA